LETASLEELSLLVSGFQSLIEEPFPNASLDVAVVGGAPGAEVADGELGDGNKKKKKSEEDIVMLPAPTNPSRLVCWTIVTHKHFDNLILICIAINCFFMAIEVDTLRGHQF
jgi:hypothetical protein